MNDPIFNDDRKGLENSILVTDKNSEQIECPNCKQTARKSTSVPQHEQYHNCKVQHINTFCNQCGYVEDKEILENGDIGFVFTVKNPYGAYCMLYTDNDNNLYYGSLSDEDQYNYCKEKANEDPSIHQVRVSRFVDGKFITENLVN